MSFRPITRSDFPLISEWLARPHVHRWWHEDHSLDHLEREYGPGIDGTERFFGYLAFAITPDATAPSTPRSAPEFAPARDRLQPFGFVQLFPIHDSPEYVDEFAAVYPVALDCWSIDYFIGEPELVGRGLGRRMVRAFAAMVWTSYVEPSALVVPVNSANVASWRMLIGAGFELVAQGEMEPDHPGDGRAHHVLRLDRPGAALGAAPRHALRPR